MSSPVPAHNDDSKESVMQSKTLDLLARGLQSQVNLSLFLFLLIVAGFVLPSLGFEKHDLPLYGDVPFSTVLIAGAAIAWGKKTVRADSAGVCSGDCDAVGGMVGPDKDAQVLESIYRAGRTSYDHGGAALAGVPLWAGDSDARPRSDCGLSVHWGWLGSRLPHRRINESWRIQLRRERSFCRSQLGQL